MLKVKFSKLLLLFFFFDSKLILNVYKFSFIQTNFYLFDTVAVFVNNYNSFSRVLVFDDDKYVNESTQFFVSCVRNFITTL